MAKKNDIVKAEAAAIQSVEQIDMFQLTKEEFENWKSQFAILNIPLSSAA